jgi:GH43 family beta-xylosidase
MADPVTVGGPWQPLFTADPFSWEGLVNEGPWMMVRGGVYYLMYSGGSYDRPIYAIGYATSDSPMGPFTKSEQNPILHTDAANDFFGPGHHSVTVGPDGALWMFYHTKVKVEVSGERRIRRNRIAFTDDGRLYVDLGIGPPRDDERQPGRHYQPRCRSKLQDARSKGGQEGGRPQQREQKP